MKTNGLRNKKKAMARAAWRSNLVSFARCLGFREADAIERWHRAAKGSK